MRQATASRRLDRHVTSTSTSYGPAQTVFAQGDRCGSVMYIRKGRVSLTVTSPAGREAVISILGAGDFFGEGVLAGQRRRRATATAVTASTIAVVEKSEMRRALHEEAPLSDWFRAHMLARNTRIEQELLGHLFNRCEKRLARMLLLLANFDEHHLVRSALPSISRDLLAELAGTTRSKVDELMNTFRKRGFIERHSERNGGVQVHRSMLSVVLQE
jgi:CRP-like cAMP-binding protein